MRRLFLGTANARKLEYLKGLFDGLPIAFVTPADLGLITFEASEEATTAHDNALEKAQSWYSVCHMPVLTEDSGLVFPDLPVDHPDQPGVHIRRANGHNMTDEELLNHFAAIIHRNGGMLRAAWQDAYCIMRTPDDYAVYETGFARLQKSTMWFCDKPSEKRVPFWPLNSLEIDPKTGTHVVDMTEEEIRRMNNTETVDHDDDRRTWLRSTVMRLTCEE